jgi:hypothetical protein
MAKLISNQYRTVSLSQRSVQLELFGSDTAGGCYRKVGNQLQPIGCNSAHSSVDPLELLMREEEQLELIEFDQTRK